MTAFVAKSLLTCAQSPKIFAGFWTDSDNERESDEAKLKGLSRLKLASEHTVIVKECYLFLKNISTLGQKKIRLSEENDEGSPSLTLTTDFRVAFAAPEKVDKSTEVKSPEYAGLIDFQSFLENLPLNRLMTFKPFRPEDLPTLPTFPPLLLPDFLRMAEPTPAASNRDRCVSKLSKEFRENEMYYDYVQEQVDEANITAAYDLVLAKAIEICSPEQVERLESFMKKYETLQKNIEELAPEYPKETRDQVLQWLREENYLAINGFISRESMANLFNAAKNSKLMQISFQLTSMQIDLFFNPI
ncbi:hypothetical protein RB195_008751 [Necator americanus]|uniref:Uncharacterized protein n=1 Tax=Necator americanus TaxID=51031 RepID=A0ABR1CSN9_NECAM